MAKNQTIRLRPQYLQADQKALTALQALRDYAPANSAYTKDAAVAGFSAMQAAQAEELRIQKLLAAARDAAAAAEWRFHNLMLGVKDQVIAQYGKDSDQIQSLGLKKKSERKSPARRKTSAT